MNKKRKALRIMATILLVTSTSIGLAGCGCGPGQACTPAQTGSGRSMSSQSAQESTNPVRNGLNELGRNFTNVTKTITNGLGGLKRGLN